MRHTDNLVIVEKFFSSKVCYHAAYFSAVDCGKYIFVVNKTTAGDVDETNAVLHVLDCVCVYKSLCVWCLWHVECKVVSLCKNCIESFCVLDHVVKAPCSVDRKEWVVTYNVHSKFNCCVCNLCTDGTETDNTKSLSLEFVADVIFLSLFCESCNFCTLSCKTVAELVCSDYRAAGHKEAEDYKFLYCICVCSRCVEYNNTLCCQILAWNVVNAGTCTGNSLNVFIKFHAEHVV